MRFKSTPSRFMGENNSALEASGDGLTSDLAEIDRPVEGDGRVLAHRDGECESRLIATGEPPHRGFEERSPAPSSEPGPRAPESAGKRRAQPVLTCARAESTVCRQLA